MYKTYEKETLEHLQRVEVGMLRDFAEVCDKHGIHYFIVAGTAIGAVRHRGMIPWDDDIDIGMLRPDYEKFLQVFQEELGERYELNGPDCERKYYNFVPNMSLKGTKFIVDLAEDKYDIGIFLDLFVYENIPDDEKGLEQQIRWSQFWRNVYVTRNANFTTLQKEAKGTVSKLKYNVLILLQRMMETLHISGAWIYKKYLKSALKYNGRTNRYTILSDPYVRDLFLTTNDIFPLLEVEFEGMKVKIVHDYHKMLKQRFGNYMQMPPEEKRANHYPKLLDFGKE